MKKLSMLLIVAMMAMVMAACTSNSPGGATLILGRRLMEAGIRLL